MSGGQVRRLAARRAVSSAHGQASVELVALVPLAVAAAFAVSQLLAFLAAREHAGAAAQAAATALVRGEDARAAAVEAIDDAPRRRVRVIVRGRRVTVRVAPRGAIATVLTAEAEADAGPPPDDAEATTHVEDDGR